MNAKDCFVVPLKPTDHDKELYRAADQNFIQVEVQLPSGEIVRSSNNRVILSLSKDAMLGLGSALIRTALDGSRDCGCWEFENAAPSSAAEQLGVYLHPSSCRLVINLVETGKLSDLLGTS